MHSSGVSLTCSDRLSTKLQYVASPLGGETKCMVHVLHNVAQKTVFDYGHTRGSFLSLEPCLVEPREEPEYETS